MGSIRSWFARPNSFAWLTGGNSVIDREGDTGVAAVGYDGDELVIVTNNIEADRIAAEELPDLEASEISIERFPWYASSLAEAITEHVGSDERAAIDIELPGFERVDPTSLRQPLTERDRDRYRDLGRPDGIRRRIGLSRTAVRRHGTRGRIRAANRSLGSRHRSTGRPRRWLGTGTAAPPHADRGRTRRLRSSP